MKPDDDYLPPGAAAERVYREISGNRGHGIGPAFMDAAIAALRHR